MNSGPIFSAPTMTAPWRGSASIWSVETEATFWWWTRTPSLWPRRESPSQAFFVTNGASVKVSNVKLVLSMTGTQSGVLLKCRILDNDNAGAVIFERECWDTADADPMQPGWGPDDPPGSYLGASGSFILSLFRDPQYLDPDVPLPPGAKAEVVYDNAEVLEYDVPSLQIAKLRAALLVGEHGGGANRGRQPIRSPAMRCGHPGRSRSSSGAANCP